MRVYGRRQSKCRAAPSYSSRAEYSCPDEKATLAESMGTISAPTDIISGNCELQQMKTEKGTSPSAPEQFYSLVM